MASNALSLLVVALLGLGGLIAWGTKAYRAPGPLAEAICLQVESGSNMRRVSEDLAGQGAVRSPEILRIGADYGDRTAALKAGSFLVPERASMAEIVGIVTGDGQSTCGTEIVYRVGVTGQRMEVRELDPATNRFSVETDFDPLQDDADPAYAEVRDQPDTRFRIAIAEGVTSWQVTEALKGADFLDGQIASVPPEGTLAPDSYEVTRGTDRAALLTEMEARQSDRLTGAWSARADGLPYDTVQEALIMASIVEKETGVPEERDRVASVFVNRLEQSMRLQTDPTVIYGITNGKGPLGRGLRQSELRRATPYNTYEIDGLPPTPIANPGLASIEAALDPARTDDLFFVADGSGGHAFAATLAEHNDNVARWRAIEAQDAVQ